MNLIGKHSDSLFHALGMLKVTSESGLGILSGLAIMEHFDYLLIQIRYLAKNKSTSWKQMWEHEQSHEDKK